MNFIKIFFLGLVFSYGVVKAQTDFRPGYIIEHSGDTIYGKIDYRGDKLMSTVCKFQSTDNSNLEFFPGDIIGFRFIDSKFFISKEIENKMVFVEYLINGVVSVFYMRDEYGDHYFIQKEGDELMELPYEIQEKYVDNKLYWRNPNSILVS